jgi:PAS domain S-box-containing protein
MKKVLLIHSYNEGYPWTDEIHRGIRDTLEKQESVVLSIDYLEANTFGTASDFALIADTYTRKYKDRSMDFDAILVSDDPAFDFMLHYRAELFPGIPVIFCGANNFDAARLRGQTDITGINQQQSIAETIDLALRIRPGTRRFAVVAGTRSTERISLASFKKIAAGYDHEFVYLDSMSIEQVKASLLSQPPDTVVIYLSYMQDANDTQLSWQDGIKLAATNPDLVVMAMSDFQIRDGILGGKVVDAYHQGKSAAQLAIRILQGERARDIPVVMESPNTYLVDDRMLERFGIALDLLPAEAELVNLSTEHLLKDWHKEGSKGLFGYELFELHGTNMLLMDPSNGTIVDANLAAREFYGYPRLIGMNIAEINTLSQEEVQNEMANARNLKKNYFNFRHRLADGSIRDIANYSWPIRIRNTDLLFSIIYDITPQRLAEADAKRKDSLLKTVLLTALVAMLIVIAVLIRLLLINRKTRTRLRTELKQKTALLDAIPEPVYFKNMDGRYFECNKAFVILCGIPKEELLGRILDDTISVDSALHKAKDREALQIRGSVLEYEKVTISPTNRVFDFLYRKAAILGDQAEPIGLVGVMTDLSERKLRENQLKASLENNRSLIKELYHRTRNNMQVINSLVMLKMHMTDDPALTVTLRDLSQRIQSMALVHQMLYESGDLSRVDFGVYLEQLFSSTISSYANDGLQIDYRIEADGIALLIDYAVPCAMVINELLTNSCKHAFTATSVGSIELKVKRDESRAIHIQYSDNGLGAGSEREERSGNTREGALGLTLVKTLAEHQLGGSLELDLSGTMRCTVRFHDTAYRERVHT